jgi:thiamine biosynthesis lipoprotein
LPACSRAPLHQQEAFVFGTRVQVLIAGLAEAEARPAAAAVLREFDRLHRSYHAWKPSELSALNEAIAAGRRQPVTPEMAELIAEAQRLTRLSEQLFDPGIGRLVSLWGFQSDELPARLPEASALAAWQAARPSIVDLRLDGSYASSRQRELALDFGGYLKGVALDRAASILKAQGVQHALINIGGNVMASRQQERAALAGRHPASAPAGPAGDGRT